jgi:hypothetical protein
MIPYRKYCFIFLSLGLLSCVNAGHNEYKANNDYINKEIGERISVLNKDSSFSGSLAELNKSVNNLLYLTIDIENINASIIKSNEFFSEAPAKYKVDTAGFLKIYKGLPLPEIIATIKRNHLNLLNKIIIDRNKDGGLMYTAQ